MFILLILAGSALDSDKFSFIIGVFKRLQRSKYHAYSFVIIAYYLHASVIAKKI